MSCTLTIIADPGPAAAADSALREARDALAAAEARARPFEMVQALCSLARCYRSRRAAMVSEALLEQALFWARASGSTDLVVDLLCELCAFSAEQALNPDAETIADAAEKALAYGSEASRLAPCVADPGWEIRVLLRTSEVFCRLGQADDAALLQERALELMAGGSRRPGPMHPALTLAAHATLQ